MPDDLATENEKFIFERVRDRYDFEHERFLNIQSRASVLAGWIGLFISILVAGGAIIFGKREVPVSISVTDINLLIGALGLLLLSMVFSLIAFRIGTYQVSPQPRPLITLYKNETHQKTLRTVTMEMTKAIEINSQRTSRKANFITVSWVLFLVGMTLSAIFIMVQMYKLLP